MKLKSKTDEQASDELLEYYEEKSIERNIFSSHFPKVRLDQVMEVLDKNRLNQDLVVFVNYSKVTLLFFSFHTFRIIYIIVHNSRFLEIVKKIVALSFALHTWDCYFVTRFDQVSHTVGPDFVLFRTPQSRYCEI